MTSLCPSQYPTNATVHIDSSVHGTTVHHIVLLPTDVEEGLLTITIDSINLMDDTTYYIAVFLNIESTSLTLYGNLSKFNILCVSCTIDGL